MKLNRISFLIKNQSGTIWITLSNIMIVFTVLAWAITLDFGIPATVKAQLQTAADSGALAGALTAETVPEKDIQIDHDASGNITGVKEVITGWHVEFTDPDAAYVAAQDAVTHNTLLLPPSEGGFTSNVSFQPSNGDMSGSIVGSDSYKVDLKAEVSTLLMGKVMELYGEDSKLDINVTGISKAYPDPEN